MGTKRSVDGTEPDERLIRATARYEQALDRLIAQRHELPREVLDELADAETELWRHQLQAKSQLQAKRLTLRLRDRVAEGTQATVS